MFSYEFENPNEKRIYNTLKRDLGDARAYAYTQLAIGAFELWVNSRKKKQNNNAKKNQSLAAPHNYSHYSTKGKGTTGRLGAPKNMSMPFNRNIMSMPFNRNINRMFTQEFEQWRPHRNFDCEKSIERGVDPAMAYYNQVAESRAFIRKAQGKIK